MLDVAHRRWSKEILSAGSHGRVASSRPVRVPKNLWRDIGCWRAATGLWKNAGRAGAGDQAAAHLEWALFPLERWRNIGTSGVVFAATAHLALDPKGRCTRFAHALPGVVRPLGVTQAAGSPFAGSGTSSHAKTNGHNDSYENSPPLPANVPPGCDGLLWLLIYG